MSNVSRIQKTLVGILRAAATVNVRHHVTSLV